MVENGGPTVLQIPAAPPNSGSDTFSSPASHQTSFLDSDSLWKKQMRRSPNTFDDCPFFAKETLSLSPADISKEDPISIVILRKTEITVGLSTQLWK